MLRAAANRATASHVFSAYQQGRPANTLDWLRTEFAVEMPGQKLENFAALDEAAFVKEVRKRRPKSAGKLTPVALRALRDGYVEQATPVQQRQAEAGRLERRLADLVNRRTPHARGGRAALAHRAAAYTGGANGLTTMSIKAIMCRW